MTTRILMHGAGGRMGRNILSTILQDEGASIAGAVDRAEHPQSGQDIGRLLGVADIGVKLSDKLEPAIEGADVVIDFSSVPALASVTAVCERFKKPLVVGTTGISDEVKAKLASLAKVAPVLVAPNMSLGVNLLFYLAGKAAEILGESYDIEIVEMHHRAKVDSPSGTAERLYESVAQARKLNVKEAAVHGRSGMVGARKANEIGVMALRGGDVVGDHTVIFAGPGERVELTHRAHTREIFASGALRAAHFLLTQPPGLYDMADVIGVSLQHSKK